MSKDLAFKENANVQFPTLISQDNKQFYPVFTDWEELKKEVTQNYKYHGRSVTDLCMWTRDTVYKDTVDVKNIHRVFLGHTVLEEIKHVGNCTFLDTGVVFGGKLSIVNLKDYC